LGAFVANFRKKDVYRAIADAERILPGRESKSRNDPRWQAIIAVGAFIESDPIPVCDFAMKWARRRGNDLQAAIYSCLTEHLLEHHFDLVFPRMRDAARKNARVADHVFGTWRSPFKFGQAKEPTNVRRLKRLDAELCRIYLALAEEHQRFQSDPCGQRSLYAARQTTRSGSG
jgi:hypothetical protein